MTLGRVVQWSVVFPLALGMEALVVVMALDWFVEDEAPLWWMLFGFATLGVLATVVTVVALLWDIRGPSSGDG